MTKIEIIMFSSLSLGIFLLSGAFFLHIIKIYDKIAKIEQEVKKNEQS